MGEIQLIPYINFQGKAREAFEFYRSVLGGTLDLQAYGEQGASRPAGPGDRIIFGRLEAEGAVILGTDGHPDFPATVGENIAIALSGTDRARLTALMNGLAEGGQLKSPLYRQPWGAEVGWLADKFGINWMVSLNDA